MRTVIRLPLSVGIMINCPLLLFNISANLFYAFCLIFARGTGLRKQPLTLLLGCLVVCSLLYCMSVIIMWIYVIFLDFNQTLDFIIHNITFLSMACSIVSYAWLNFYYYIQIVPARSALFLWVKRNIKRTVYVALANDVLVIVLSRNVDFLQYLKTSRLGVPNNDTATFDSCEELCKCSFYLVNTHHTLLLCVVMASSLSTVRYLRKHIRSMRRRGTSFSATRLRGQMRVTVTGSCQGLFFFLYGSFMLLDSFLYKFSGEFYFELLIPFTVTTLFISGTTLTLGIGQNAFRKRIIDVYKAVCVSASVRRLNHPLKNYFAFC